MGFIFIFVYYRLAPEFKFPFQIEDNFSVYSNRNSNFELNAFANLNSNDKANEFKTKYKTEICKFWQLNMSCKFGEKVNSFFLYNSFMLKIFKISFYCFISKINLGYIKTSLCIFFTD